MKWLCKIGIHRYTHIYYKWNDKNVTLHKCERCNNKKIKKFDKSSKKKPFQNNEVQK
jgi:hypothetical protein